MKILSTKQVKEADNYTIEHEPILSVDLMERAASQSTNWIFQNFPLDKKFKIFAGPGNNGGDGLAIARLLAEVNYKVDVFIIKVSDNFSPDFLANLERLTKQNKVKIVEINESDKLPTINQTDIIIDAIFGSGLTKIVIGFAAKIISYINLSQATVISIDIPSGLFGEENPPANPNIIKADYTLTFEFPFLSFFYPENEEYVGEVVTLPINIHKDFINSAETNFYYLTKEFISSKIHKRRKFSHKGNYGHAFLISGSIGKIGAAVLASSACLRSGVGLLTVHTPKVGHYIMQTAVPEAMLSVDQQEEVSSEFYDIENYNVIGVGPGIGLNRATRLMLKVLVQTAEVPLVIDADAINIIADNKDWMNNIPDGSIFTPHPKEFERLVGKSKNNFHRNQMQLDFAKKYNVYVLLKGANTAIACPDGTCYFNTTGNPGMATAGSGDVLTGIILSLLAQGYTSKDACMCGVYLHGLAGDIAKEFVGEDSLIAGDIIKYLPKAFKEIKSY